MPPLVVQVTIVSYRTAELVKKSLQALLSERGRLAERNVELRVFIIDNSGQDYEPVRAEVEARGWLSWVHVVRAERNGGFAYGNNRGFEYGLSQPVVPDYFYLLNPDAEVRPNAIFELLSFMESHPKAGAAASGIEDHVGTLWPWAFRFPNLFDEFQRGVRLGVVTRLLSPFVVGRKLRDEAQEVDWFPGAGMICRTEVLTQLGGMDEAYFLYFEETDFCLKLVEHGWTNWYVPNSRITHETGKSTGVTAAGNQTAPLPQYWFESRRRYFLKNHGPLYAIATDLLALAGHALGALQFTLRGRGAELRKHFLRDLLRHGCLRPSSLRIEAPKDMLQLGALPAVRSD